MTETATAATPTASPLAALFLSNHPDLSIEPYRGVLTPIELDARGRETAALTSTAAVHDLGWLRRVAVKGEDRFRWLSGMVTNVVNDLPPNGGAWNLVLNAQGRIQGDLTVWRNDENLELEIAADQYDRLLAHLDRFIIMDDVELSPIDPEDSTAIGLTGPKSGEILQKLGLPANLESMTSVVADWNGKKVLLRRDYGVLAEHYEIWVAAEAVNSLWHELIVAGAQPAGVKAIESLRVAEAIPAYGIDMVERDLPQETSQTRTLNFNKGCYLGQEIVERIRSRGNVHRHLRLMELNGPMPQPGTELTRDEKPAGHLTSAAEITVSGHERRFALGMVRSEAEVGSANLRYTTDEAAGSAQILAGPPALIQEG